MIAKISRIASCVLLPFVVGCSSTQPPAGPIGKLTVSGTAALKTGPCNAITVSAQDDKGGALTLSQAMTVSLSGSGAGSFYSTLAACTGNQASTTTQIPAGASQATVYFKDYNAESLTLAAACGGQSASLAVTVTADPFTKSGTFVDGSVYGIDLTPDGHIYVGGNFDHYGTTSRSKTARLMPNGALDTAYVPPVLSNVVHAILVAKDGSGSVYIAGEFLGAGGGANNDLLIRVAADGTLLGGPPAAITSPVYGMALAYPGNDTSHILFGGTFGSYAASGFANFLRLNADLSFNSWLHAPGASRGNPYKVTAIAPLSDGRVYLAGQALASCDGVANGGICRIKADGTGDTAFSVAAGSFTGGSPTSLTLVPGGSGDVYVGGNFSQFKGHASAGLVRIKADGSYDSSFSVAGFGGTGLDVYTILPLDDGTGDLLVGGYFTTYGGVTTGSLVRLKSDGTRVTSFSGPDPSLQAVRALKQLPDGSNRVLVGGDMSTYAGTSVNGLVRIRASGALD